ncbi:hypothetical protein TNCV_527531 [Trichonephila clavipes]|nr:hypothetical protein TNCV_527531 [Trichonephila clavipes]
MFKVIEWPTKCEIRFVIRFLTARNMSAVDIHRPAKEGYGTEIVRVEYLVRGGFVGHRSRASSKASLPSSSGRRARFLGVKQGLRCTCKLHVWVSGPQRKPTRC